MLRKMIAGDLSRNRMINLALFFFILIPSVMMSNAVSMIFSLSVSLDRLFQAAEVPHFVQMHAGEIDWKTLREWNRSREDIESFQAVEMITIDGSEVFLSENGESEAVSVMDLGFVRQNRDFDFLLNLQNETLTVGDGEIAVPLYHREKNGLKTGGRVILKHGDIRMSFKIVSFVRDAQMNPAIIHSKRFVVSDGDFALLKEDFGESEYLLEYRLQDPGQTQTFAEAYGNAGLPSSGPAVDIGLFRVINAVSDGLTITVLVLLSLLFCLTAVLCLRFTLLASLEEDYREIGVMKGIGFPPGFIRKIYLGKYLLMGAGASLLGWGLSFPMYRGVSGHIRLYMGDVSRSAAGVILPFAGGGLVFLTVCLSCLIVLRRFDTISAVQALRAGRETAGHIGVGILSLRRLTFPGFNLTLAVRDVLLRGRMFGTLGLVFTLCSFIILVPLNFLNTISSPGFVSYMGIGKSDIRIDLGQGGDREKRFQGMMAFLEADPDVETMAPAVTYRCGVRTTAGGGNRSISIETGDFSVFPQDYLEGDFPRTEAEIALSLLNAKELAVVTGDTLILTDGNRESVMRVCGIYQDVTNGGYTAKASVLPFRTDALWYRISLNLRAGVSGETKIQEYSGAFSPARVTDIEFYIEQTLGETIGMLRKITLLAAAAALSGIMLITSLFLRMVLTLDASQITIMRGIGFSRDDIRRQYLSRVLMVLVLGTMAGTLGANSLGQGLVSSLWALMGASRIRFIIDPFTAYVLVPAVLVLLVFLTSVKALKGTSSDSSCRIADLNAE